MSSTRSCPCTSGFTVAVASVNMVPLEGDFVVETPPKSKGESATPEEFRCVTRYVMQLWLLPPGRT